MVRFGGVAGGVRNAVARGIFRLPRPVLRRLAGPPVVVDGKTLDVEMQLLLRLQRIEGPPVESLPISRARRQVVSSARTVGGRHPIGAITERTIEGPGGPIGLRFYTPRGVTGTSPALVYFHGGSFMHGDLDSHDPFCRMLAEQAQVRVIAVDYRLAPEAPFPAAVEDVWAAWTWVNSHAAGLGVDPSRIAVGGDSAGGNLSAVVAQRAVRALRQAQEPKVPAPAFQLLIYPVTQFGQPTKSRDTYAEGFYLTRTGMDLSDECYLVGNEDLADPRLSPLLHDPSGLAPAHVVTAGFDPLHDEGEAYADRLRNAGVPVDYQCEEELIHAFTNMGGLGRSAPAAISRIAAALQRGLS
ncbi:alpha/beta hydrolase [Aeromicrobium sp.]|uniref:alpha/beta hydrolase n=1 Tax=Aeromicrobium sp. TaxID=1871063 RepID=UPI003D6C41A6